MNDNTKSTITMCIAAILSVAMICGSVVMITDKTSTYAKDIATAAVASKTHTGTNGKGGGNSGSNGNNGSSADPYNPGGEVIDVASPLEPKSKSTAEAVSSTTDNSGDSTQKTAKTTTTAKKSSTTTKTTQKTTAKTTAAAKLTRLQIINNYNAAINKVRSSKAGYSKSRTTKLNSLDGGALVKNNTVKGVVSDFLGVGTKTYTNSKGKSEFMSAASLKLADVSDASYKLSGGNYTYTIKLNKGSSSASGSGKTNSSPVDRSGIFVGSGDKSAYDHKCAENLYTAINGADGASVGSVSENTSNVSITAVVNASSGKLVSLMISFNFAVKLSNIKYILTIKAASGTASTSVSYSSFKW